jgi:hypothetical protein
MYDDKTVRLTARTRGLAIGMLVAAWLLPLAWALTPFFSAFEAGEFFAQILLASGFIIMVVGFVFRKSSPLSKAKARLAVSIVMLVWSGAHAVTAAQGHAELRDALSNVERTLDYTEQARDEGLAGNQAPAEFLKTSAPASASTEPEKVVLARFLNQVAESRRKQSDKMQALTEQYADLDLSSVLTPANLVDAEAIDKSKKTLNEYSRFLDERHRLFYALTAESEAMVNNSNLPPKALETAKRYFNEGKRSTIRLMEDLDLAQRGIVTEAASILTMCEANLGEFSVKDNNVMFRTEEQLAFYREHLAKLQEAAAQEEKAMKGIVEADAQNTASVRKDLAAMK